MGTEPFTAEPERVAQVRAWAAGGGLRVAEADGAPEVEADLDAAGALPTSGERLRAIAQDSPWESPEELEASSRTSMRAGVEPDRDNSPGQEIVSPLISDRDGVDLTRGSGPHVRGQHPRQARRSMDRPHPRLPFRPGPRNPRRRASFTQRCTVVIGIPWISAISAAGLFEAATNRLYWFATS
jgi:hypothetical protein